MIDWNTSYNWGPQLWYNQDLNTSSDITGNTFNSGQGKTELYNYDHAVLLNLNTTIGLSALANAEVDQLENIGATTISALQWGYIGNMDQNVRQASSVIFDKVSTGHGSNELYSMNQDVETNDAVTFLTVNTGQGNNELFSMDQDVESDDNVEFDNLELTETTTNTKLHIYADNSYKAKLFWWDADDGNYWESYIDEDAPDVFYWNYWDGTNIEYGMTLRYTIADEVYTGFGDLSPGYRVETPNVGSTDGRMRANAFTPYSDIRAKTKLIENLPREMVCSFCENVSTGIWLFAWKDCEQDIDGTIYINNTNYSRLDLGIPAQYLFNWINDTDRFGQYAERLAHMIVHVPKDESKDFWSVNYNAVHLLYNKYTSFLQKDIKILEQKATEEIIENRQHIKHIETWLKNNTPYEPLPWD